MPFMNWFGFILLKIRNKINICMRKQEFIRPGMWFKARDDVVKGIHVTHNPWLTQTRFVCFSSDCFSKDLFTVRRRAFLAEELKQVVKH